MDNEQTKLLRLQDSPFAVEFKIEYLRASNEIKLTLDLPPPVLLSPDPVQILLPEQLVQDMARLFEERHKGDIQFEFE